MAEITKSYESRDVEQKWYAAWQKAGCFAGKVTADIPAYSIAIPPPNVTGVLTMGHVLNNTIQDILVRRARLEGKSAMWLPGTDHAGIATQTVVERQLRKEKKTRHDFGREKFVEKVWEWREEKGGIILEQLRRLGASVEEHADGMTIAPVTLHGGSVRTYDDHRMAMSLSLVGLRVPGVAIQDPGCVGKTFPGYWHCLGGLAGFPAGWQHA
jgi:valyl-tRNA synthetase